MTKIAGSFKRQNTQQSNADKKPTNARPSTLSRWITGAKRTFVTLLCCGCLPRAGSGKKEREEEIKTPIPNEITPAVVTKGSMTQEEFNRKYNNRTAESDRQYDFNQRYSTYLKSNGDNFSRSDNEGVSLVRAVVPKSNFHD